MRVFPVSEARFYEGVPRVTRSQWRTQMTNSKAPWLTRGGAIALMAAAAIALAACSGGGGLNEDEAAGILQELKEARAQAATDVAARVAAET